MPVSGSSIGSPQPPDTPNEIVPPRGLSDGSLMSSEPDFRNEPAILIAIRWPAVPENENHASWPGVVIVAAAVPPDSVCAGTIEIGVGTPTSPGTL